MATTTSMTAFRKILVVAWALPWSALGAAIGAAGLAGRGASVRCRAGAVEFHGPWIRWLLDWLPNQPTAMTLGHVIIGRSPAVLERAGRHERVHVRQYERWGPLLVPAYLLCGLWLWLAGAGPYWDNPFEREAFRH